MTDAAKLAPALGLSEAEVVAATVWGEARGESVLGRIGVAHVIRNRMIARRQTAGQVCLAPLQFSCWWRVGGGQNHTQMLRLMEHFSGFADPVWRECLWVARGVLSGECLDVTKGADHYVTTVLLNSPARPGCLSRP